MAIANPGKLQHKSENAEFLHELFSIAVPVGLQNLLIALIGGTDALMLGRLSQDAVSAVSLANQVAFVMNLFTGAVLTGGGALAAQCWGKKDKEATKNLFCMMLKYSFVISFIFFLLAFFAPEALMKIFTSDSVLIEIGSKYLKAVSFSYVFSGLTGCYYLKMKIEGNASKSVVISVFTLLADVFIDLFLIYGLCGVPKLGAVGSAYSTVAVEAVGLLLCIWDSHRKDNIHADASGFKWFSREITRDFFKIALPALGSSLLWGLSISAHSLIMGHLGSDAAAAASVTAVTEELITCLCKGISTGAGIITGKLLGQKLFDKAKAYGKKLCKISLLFGFVNMLLLCIAGPLATHFFVLSDKARDYLIFMLVFSGIYVFAYSVNAVIVCGIFPAGGDTKYDAVSVLIATWCISLPLAFIAAFYFKLPVNAVYVLMCLDEIIKLPFLYPGYKKYKWLKNLTESENEESPIQCEI